MYFGSPGNHFPDPSSLEDWWESVFFQNWFFISNFPRSILPKVVIWTIRTILIFGKTLILTGKIPSRIHFFGKCQFLKSLLNELIWFGQVSKSSSLSVALPQGLLFPENMHSWISEAYPSWEIVLFCATLCYFSAIWCYLGAILVLFCAISVLFQVYLVIF